MQLAAPVTADRDQRGVRSVAKARGNPQPLQELVNKFSAGFNELFGGVAVVKRRAQPLLKSVEMLFDLRAVKRVGRLGGGVIRLSGKRSKRGIHRLLG